jgi:hypothetical protein
MDKNVLLLVLYIFSTTAFIFVLSKLYIYTYYSTSDDNNNIKLFKRITIIITAIFIIISAIVYKNFGSIG